MCKLWISGLPPFFIFVPVYVIISYARGFALKLAVIAKGTRKTFLIACGWRKEFFSHPRSLAADYMRRAGSVCRELGTSEKHTKNQLRDYMEKSQSG